MPSSVFRYFARSVVKPIVAPECADASAFSTSTHFSIYRSSTPRWLRCMALVTSTTLLWSTLFAMPAQVLAHDNKPAFGVPNPTPAAAPHDDPSWHTIDYHAQEHVRPTQIHKSGKTSSQRRNLSMLDEVGRLDQPISQGQVQTWKTLLHQPRKLGAAQIAKLHVWVGEFALARDEQPEQALWHFA